MAAVSAMALRIIKGSWGLDALLWTSAVALICLLSEYALKFVRSIHRQHLQLKARVSYLQTHIEEIERAGQLDLLATEEQLQVRDLYDVYRLLVMKYRPNDYSSPIIHQACVDRLTDEQLNEVLSENRKALTAAAESLRRIFTA